MTERQLPWRRRPSSEPQPTVDPGMKPGTETIEPATIQDIVRSVKEAETSDRDAMERLAAEAASTDVNDALDPECPAPTPGEQRVEADADVRARAADQRCADAARSVAARIDVIDQEKAAAQRGEHVTAGWHRRAVVLVGLLLVAVAATVEKFALEGPLATSMQMVQGSLENQAVAFLMAFGAAGAAAIAGEAWVASLDSLGGRPNGSFARRRLMRTVAWAALVPLVVIATLASLARITMLDVAASFSGIPPTVGEQVGVVLVQVVFILVALVIGFGTALLSRLAEQRAEDRYLRDLDAERDALARFLENVDEFRGAHAVSITAARQAAMTEYRSALVSGFAKHNPDAAVHWEQRFGCPEGGAAASEPAGPHGPGPSPHTSTGSNSDEDPPEVIDLRDIEGADIDDGDDDLFAAVSGPAA